MAQVDLCPFCEAMPYRVDVDYSLRLLADQLPIYCPYCRQRIQECDLKVHVNYCSQRPLNWIITQRDFQIDHKRVAVITASLTQLIQIVDPCTLEQLHQLNPAIELLAGYVM